MFRSFGFKWFNRIHKNKFIVSLFFVLKFNPSKEHRSSDVRGSNKSFSALNFKPWLTEALQKNGYKFQAKVQEATLPTVLTGHDVIIQVKILDFTVNFGLEFLTIEI